MNKRVCIVRHRAYERDARIDNQVQALLDAGYEVDLLLMRRSGELFRSIERGATVYRVPCIQRIRGSQVRYFAEYVSFLILSAVWLSCLQIRRGYCMAQMCSLPDFLVFSAVVPKLASAKIILDLRECTPEQYSIKYRTGMDSWVVRTLIAIEQASIRFADAALTCTEQMRLAFVSRGADPGKVFVMLNCADPELFRDPVFTDPPGQGDGCFHIVTHGTITKRYAIDILVRAMAIVIQRVPNARLEIMGSGNARPDLQQLVASLGLKDVISITGFLPFCDLMATLRRAHCGVVSLVRNIETDLIHTNKMSEYMALGIPVVATRTTAVQAYYDDNSILPVESGSEQDLARAIIALACDPKKRHDLRVSGFESYQKYSADGQRAQYLNLVRSLLNGTLALSV